MRLLPAALALLAAGCSARAPLLIAHRGDSGAFPENTMPAFESGWKTADGNELDLWLSKDGRAVVLHDASTKRTAGLDKPAAEQTLAELQALDAGAWKGPGFRGVRIPTLEEVVTAMPWGPQQLFIELKAGPEILPDLVRVLDAAGEKRDLCALIAFNRETLRRAKVLLPDLEAYWIVGYTEDKKTGRYPEIDDLIAKAKEAELDGLDLSHKFPIDRAFVEKVRAAGLRFFVWTVNEVDDAKRLAEAGVEGITTDHPARLRAALSR